MRVIKRLEARANATLNSANEGIDYAKDLVADLKDGVGFTIRPRKGFSKFASRLLLHVFEYMYYLTLARLAKIIPFLGDRGYVQPELNLTWMETQDIPLLISLDPTVDTLPPRIAKFSGGPYDGREFLITDQNLSRLTLAGGSHYAWDGHVFLFSE
jgi:hypothetical protein